MGGASRGLFVVIEGPQLVCSKDTQLQPTRGMYAVVEINTVPFCVLAEGFGVC